MATDITVARVKMECFSGSVAVPGKVLNARDITFYERGGPLISAVGHWMLQCFRRRWSSACESASFAPELIWFMSGAAPTFCKVQNYYNGER